MFQLNKWWTLHVDGGGKSQDEIQSMEEENDKHEGYVMKVMGYSDNYANNLHVAWDIIKKSKVLSGIKMIVSGKFKN